MMPNYSPEATSCSPPDTASSGSTLLLSIDLWMRAGDFGANCRSIFSSLIQTTLSPPTLRPGRPATFRTHEAPLKMPLRATCCAERSLCDS